MNQHNTNVYINAKTKTKNIKHNSGCCTDNNIQYIEQINTYMIAKEIMPE